MSPDQPHDATHINTHSTPQANFQINIRKIFSLFNENLKKIKKIIHVLEYLTKDS
jgi:hypothetical protein